MRNNKGITLIALVITIIVLLILAGVSIAMLTGQNGILNQATQAKTETAKAEAVEKINMALSAAYAEAKNPTQPVTPSEATIKAYDTTLTQANGYTIAADTSKVTISYSKDGITTSGSISIASPYTVTPASK